MNNNILEIVKTLLNITTDEKDDILNLHIDMAMQDVLNQTKRYELPIELIYVVARMVRLSFNTALPETNFTAPVTNVSEAGRSVSFASASLTELAIEKERNDIASQINKFKLPFWQETSYDYEVQEWQ